MKGTIRAYSRTVNAGVIEGDDGKSYGFSQADWQGSVAPINDQIVRFDGNSRQATTVRSEDINRP